MQLKISRGDWQYVKVYRHRTAFGQVHFGLLKEADNIRSGSAICSKQSGERRKFEGHLWGYAASRC